MGIKKGFDGHPVQTPPSCSLHSIAIFLSFLLSPQKSALFHPPSVGQVEATFPLTGRNSSSSREQAERLQTTDGASTCMRSVNHPSTFADMIFAFGKIFAPLATSKALINFNNHKTSISPWSRGEGGYTTFSFCRGHECLRHLFTFSDCEISSVAQFYHTLPPFSKHRLTFKYLTLI